MHVLNVDGDIGPMLQAVKLRSLKDTAEKYERPHLSGAEMEAMNLAGPVTGLEMMMPAGQKAPVTNFFARTAYYVNKMVIGLDGRRAAGGTRPAHDGEREDAGVDRIRRSLRPSEQGPHGFRAVNWPREDHPSLRAI